MEPPPGAELQYVQGRRALGWRASDQLVQAAMSAGALLCVSFLPSNVGVTETSPIKNSKIDESIRKCWSDSKEQHVIQQLLSPLCNLKRSK